MQYIRDTFMYFSVIIKQICKNMCVLKIYAFILITAYLRAVINNCTIPWNESMALYVPAL